MSISCNYLPNPPRVWSRVQNPCTYVIPDNSYNSIYIPLTNETTTLAQANIQEKLQYKGNILQYKCNSSGLTKNQKYAQISKGLWTNRTKSFATQTQTYTNPNTSGLARVNYAIIPFPNQIVGSPNNISGPYQYGVPNPFDCSSNSIQDGGSLVCNSYADPCSGAIIQTVSQQQCFPTYCSDVPGQIMDLCWNPQMQTYFPRNRLTMSNSLNKWPQGYKGFQSAVSPVNVDVSINGSDYTYSYSNEEVDINLDKNMDAIVENKQVTNVKVNNVKTNNSKVTNKIVNENKITNKNENVTINDNNVDENKPNNNVVVNVNVSKPNTNGYHENGDNRVIINVNVDNNDNDELDNFIVITETDNEDNSINIEDYITPDNNIVNIHNKTNTILLIKSQYLIFNNFYSPEGTNLLELSNNCTATMYHLIHDDNEYFKANVF